MGLLIPLIIIALCCLVIWRAGDGFMVASEYVGRNLSEGVRGATINAIASSMPEVFTSFFFLFVLNDATGFSGGIGTTAGSAIFNSMVIPAVSIIAVISMGVVKKIEISRKVLFRDGIALIIAEFIFLILISGSSLDWHHGLLLMSVYVVYIVFMFASMDKKTKEALVASAPQEGPVEAVEGRGSSSFFLAVITLDLKRVFIGKAKINDARAWFLLVTATMCIAGVCYWLVLACEWLGEKTYEVPYLGTFEGLDIPVMFVALILASAASSFPDTIISIKDAKKGNYDDAISNALGSNIFDVCFALGFPLFVFTLINGPIVMSEDIIDLSSELRLLLLLSTVAALVVFTTGKYMGRGKAFILLGIYVFFVTYIVGRGTGNEWAQSMADGLVSVVHFFNIN
ncbi:MAG: sodium:calcium antiporter [Proteobacteria bacterium]|nr:sodium:calcium antiporter [Pseudomonadota bacterium]